MSDTIGNEEGATGANGSAPRSSTSNETLKGNGPNGQALAEKYLETTKRHKTIKAGVAELGLRDEEDIVEFIHTFGWLNNWSNEAIDANVAKWRTFVPANGGGARANGNGEEKGSTGPLPAGLEWLTKSPNWVVWRFVTEDGRRTKKPYQTHGKDAKANDKKTWTSYGAVCTARKEFDGIGYVLTDTEIVAFDIDNCRDPKTGELDPWAKALVEKCNTYTEITPSKTGIRIIGEGSGKKISPTPRTVHGDVKCEIYRKCTRYITVTGDVLLDRPLANIDAHIDAVFNELGGKEEQPRPERAPAVMPESAFAMVNEEALANLDRWVPVMLPAARRSGDGGWRVTSAALGRDLQEALSFHPSRTPIDAVMEWHLKVSIEDIVSGAAGIEKVCEAANYLWKLLGHDTNWCEDYDAIASTIAPLNSDQVTDALLAEMPDDGSSVAENPPLASSQPSPSVDDDDDDGPEVALATDDSTDLDAMIRTGGAHLYKGNRSKAVWRVINLMLTLGYLESTIVKTLLDKRNGIAVHVLAQAQPRAFAERQVTKAKNSSTSCQATPPACRITRRAIAASRCSRWG
jgi:hypothetical protein